MSTQFLKKKIKSVIPFILLADYQSWYQWISEKGNVNCSLDVAQYFQISESCFDHIVMSWSFWRLHMPALQTVQTLETRNLKPESYRGLFRTLPSVKSVSVYVCNCDRDLWEIASEIRKRGVRFLTSIKLDGLNAEQRTISDATVGLLCDVIREAKFKLVSIRLEYLLMIGSGRLISIIEALRCIRSLRSITWVIHSLCTLHEGNDPAPPGSPDT